MADTDLTASKVSGDGTAEFRPAAPAPSNGLML